MKKIGAVFAATAVAATGLMLNAAGPAVADTNPNIDVKVVEQMVRVNQNLEPTTGAMTINTAGMLKFTWDATNANPKPGDSFYIGIPDALINRGVAANSQGVSRDLIFNDQKVGDCLVQAQRITCTLNEQIRGKRNIKGEGSIVMNAAKETTENYVEFDLNGKVTRVNLPGDKPITKTPGASGWNDWGYGKAAYTLSADSTEVTWSVVFGTKYLAEKTSKTFDGSRQTLSFKDKLGEGAKFDTDLSKYRLVLRTSEARPGMDATVLTYANGNDATVDYGDFDLTFKVEDGHGVFTVTGPFEANTNYQLVYSTPFTNGTMPQPSFYYTNEITLVGSDLVRAAKHRYEHAVNITIQMEDGYGALTVMKKITGAAADAVAADIEYPVSIAYELPAGTTEQDYPTWGDKKPVSNPFTVKVKAGVETEVPFHFPHGTKVTVSEPGFAGTKTADGKVLWGTPVIKIDGVGDNDTASTTIENQVVGKVEITNEANVPPTPPAPNLPEQPLEPKPEPKQPPKPSLAKTGADGMLPMAGLAAFAVTLGAGAVYGASRVRRKK